MALDKLYEQRQKKGRKAGRKAEGRRQKLDPLLHIPRLNPNGAKI